MTETTTAGTQALPCPAARDLEVFEQPGPLSQWQRVVTLIVMLVPLAGLIIAMALAWGWGFGWVELGLLLGMYLATGLGVTVGYHRLFTHRSFETGPVLTAVFRILG